MTHVLEFRLAPGGTHSADAGERAARAGSAASGGAGLARGLLSASSAEEEEQRADQVSGGRWKASFCFVQPWVQRTKQGASVYVFVLLQLEMCRVHVGANQLKHASPDSTEKTAQLADRIAPWSRAQVNSVTLCLCDLESTLEGGTLESRGFPQER